jgi:septum site-determining protein MinD
VVLCDADFGLNNVDVVCGVEKSVLYDVVDVIEGRCRAKQALVRHPKFYNLFLLASRTSTPERFIAPQALKLVLDGLSAEFDYILIDSPAGIDEGFHRAACPASEAIVVTTPQVSAIRDADKVITLLKSYEFENVSVVINKLRGDLLVAGESLTPPEISELLRCRLLGVLPEEYGIFGGELCDIHPAFKTLANNLLLGKRKLYDVTKKYLGVIGGIRRFLKKNV